MTATDEGPRIVTRFEATMWGQPWLAWAVGSGPADPVGRGETEQEARDDLARQMEERE